jgi:diguanylate cyclase (GGDEF)-like protein
LQDENKLLHDYTAPGTQQQKIDMTLYRQIIISMISLFVLGFLGTVIITTGNLRTFLITQLEIHAQDTATSLGLSLSRPVQANDMTIVHSMVDAIYDRGYYQVIEVTSIDDMPLITRKHPDVTQNIPGWFINLVDLQAPTAEAMIMSGWTHAANVYVTSHPGNAYKELWSSTIGTFWLFLISASVILTLGLLAVHYLLRPLREVEIQADAICNRSYPVQEKLPRTRELRQVVMAMNRLSVKISEIFSEQSALTERLREQAFQDPVTGLGNRRYFDRQIENLVESREDSSHGALLLLEIRGLTDINESSGYVAGDQLLQRAADILGNATKSIDNCFAARISGAEYSIVAAGLDQGGAISLAEILSHDLLQLRIDGHTRSEDIGHIGVALWKQGDTVYTLLSEADAALRTAQSSGQNTWQLYETAPADHTEIHGNEQWRLFLEQAINSGNISLMAQPVYGLDKETPELLHKEILLRIHDNKGQPVKAGSFMPMAERMGFASAIDKLAISNLLTYMAYETDKLSIYAINLSSSSIHNPVFVQWLCSQLHAAPASARRLLIEFSEYSALKNIQETRNLIARLEAHGCHCGIDHFGRGFYSFSYLRSIKIRYLKIDGSYIRGLDKEEDNRFFIKALTDTAHSIDIKVIAQTVETLEERDTLRAMKLDGIQGYLTGKPETLQ